MSYTIETKEQIKKSEGDSEDSYDNDMLSNEKYIKHSQQSVDGSEGQSLLQADNNSSLDNAKRSCEEVQDEASVDLNAKKLQWEAKRHLSLNQSEDPSELSSSGLIGMMNGVYVKTWES